MADEDPVDTGPDPTADAMLTSCYTGTAYTGTVADLPQLTDQAEADDKLAELAALQAYAAARASASDEAGDEQTEG